jgi:Reverse transcriptase (RNA-dependent DNA polymerase)
LNQPVKVSSEIEKYLPPQSSIHEFLGVPWKMEELMLGVAAMKFSKSVGPDFLPIEFAAFIKSKLFLRRVLDVFNNCLQTGEVEPKLKDVIISFLHKKGDKFDCTNYRTLSLISHMGKVLERMILNRLNTVAEENAWLPESQNGFRNERGTLDSLLCSRMISTYCRQKGLPCYIAFVDLTKAYDKVDRDILWMVLERLGVPRNFVQLIRAVHVGAQARVKDSGSFSNTFELIVGLKQGSVISPILFNIFFGAIIKAINLRLDGENGIMLKYRHGNDIFYNPYLQKGHRTYKVLITDLLFADDAAFISHSESGLQSKMDIVVEVVSAFGQLVSIKKTEVLLVQPRVCKGVEKLPDPRITIDGQVLKVVSKFKYVGSMQNTTASVTDEINTRVQRMAMAYKAKRQILFENRRLQLRVRLQGFATFVLTAGIYGCETWNCTAAELAKLESKQFWYLRRIFGYHWERRKSFADLIHEARMAGVNILPISALVHRARLVYFGHVNRMNDSRYPKIILNAECVGGKKIRGGQELSYKRAVLGDFKAFHIDDDFNFWSKAVRNREQWRRLVKTTGIEWFMQKWFDDRCNESNKRHSKLDPNYILKIPYKFAHLEKKKPQESGIINLDYAISTGAVTVGRGRKEKTTSGLVTNSLFSQIQNEAKEALGGFSGFVRNLLVGFSSSSYYSDMY